ncbi:MAG: DUF2125 domain-containing protein [Pseudomonadota bacterium]
MTLGRPPLGAVLPVVAALLIGIGWTVFWVQAGNHAETLFAQWRSEQARQGTEITCAREERGGYPFQFSFTCFEPSITHQTAEGPAEVNGHTLRLVALVYDPTRFIAELDGPVLARRGVHEIEMAWNSARMSLRFTADPVNPQWRQSDIVLEQPNITLSEFGRARGVYSAEQTQLHFRTAPEQAGSVDTALSAVAPQLLIARAEALNLDAAELIARIDNLPGGGPGGIREWLSRWQASNGVAELIGLRMTAKDALSHTRGTLRLDRQGYPEGTLNIVNADVDPATIPSGDPLGVAQFAAATVSAVGTPVEIEGRTGREVALRLERGRVHLGPMAVMPLPRLF